MSDMRVSNGIHGNFLDYKHDSESNNGYQANNGYGPTNFGDLNLLYAVRDNLPQDTGYNPDNNYNPGDGSNTNIGDPILLYAIR
jgi:hypothetical protein